MAVIKSAFTGCNQGNKRFYQKLKKIKNLKKLLLVIKSFEVQYIAILGAKGGVT